MNPNRLAKDHRNKAGGVFEGEGGYSQVQISFLNVLYYSSGFGPGGQAASAAANAAGCALALAGGSGYGPCLQFVGVELAEDRYEDPRLD